MDCWLFASQTATSRHVANSPQSHWMYHLAYSSSFRLAVTWFFGSLALSTKFLLPPLLRRPRSRIRTRRYPLQSFLNIPLLACLYRRAAKGAWGRFRRKMRVFHQRVTIEHCSLLIALLGSESANEWGRHRQGSRCHSCRQIGLAAFAWATRCYCDWVLGTPP